MSKIYDDEWHGHGGSYRVDPKTGKRTPVQPPAELSKPAAAAAAAAQPITAEAAKESK